MTEICIFSLSLILLGICIFSILYFSWCLKVGFLYTKYSSSRYRNIEIRVKPEIDRNQYHYTLNKLIDNVKFIKYLDNTPTSSVIVNDLIIAVSDNLYGYCGFDSVKAKGSATISRKIFKTKYILWVDCKYIQSHAIDEDGVGNLLIHEIKHHLIYIKTGNFDVDHKKEIWYD